MTPEIETAYGEALAASAAKTKAAWRRLSGDDQAHDVSDTVLRLVVSALQGTPSMTVREIAERVERSPRTIKIAMTVLSNRKLASRSGANPPRWTLTDDDLATIQRIVRGAAV